MQTGAVTLENSMEVPQEIKNRAILQPRNCTTRYLSKGYKNADSNMHMHPNVYSSTIECSQSMERAQMSIDGWMDKEDVVYIHNAVLLNNQKEWNLAICNNVEGTRGYAKRTKSEKDKYHMTSFIGAIYETNIIIGKGKKK